MVPLASRVEAMDVSRRTGLARVVKRRARRASGKGGETRDGVSKRRKTGARGTSNGGTADTSPPSKYASFTFYDATKGAVVDAHGAEVVASPSANADTTSPAPVALDQVPAAILADVNALYACEPADAVTIKLLADAAGLTIGELEYRRRGVDTMAGQPLQCPRPINKGMRRYCQRCPHWTLNPQATPF